MWMFKTSTQARPLVSLGSVGWGRSVKAWGGGTCGTRICKDMQEYAKISHPGIALQLCPLKHTLGRSLPESSCAPTMPQALVPTTACTQTVEDPSHPHSLPQKDNFSTTQPEAEQQQGPLCGLRRHQQLGMEGQELALQTWDPSVSPDLSVSSTRCLPHEGGALSPPLRGTLRMSSLADKALGKGSAVLLFFNCDARHHYDWLCQL